MEANTYYAIVMFFFCCEIAAKDFQTPVGTFKSNCFLHKTENECESAITEWYGIFYGCEMVIDLDFTIQKIGLVDNQTLVYGGNSLTYAIDEFKEEARLVDKVIPIFEEIVDLHNNTYFLADGSNYVILNSTGELIEIKTGNKSLNQLAMNVDGRKLFILKPRENEVTNSDNRGGDFYVADLLPYSDYIARLDTFRKHITAISTLNGKLLLGLRTVNDTGKLIRLRKLPVQSNPCNINIRKAINDLNMIYVEFLAEFCEDHASDLAASSPFYNDTLNSLTSENIALKIKLDEAQLNCNTPEKPNSEIIKIGSRHTRDTSSDDYIDVIYGDPPRFMNGIKEEVEECPPTYKIQLENGNLKAELRITTTKFNNLISAVDALNLEFEENPVPAAEVETYEKGYRVPQKCLEAYQLNALTASIERLEKVEVDLRQKLTEYAQESKIIIDEENPETKEVEDADDY